MQPTRRNDGLHFGIRRIEFLGTYAQAAALSDVWAAMKLSSQANIAPPIVPSISARSIHRRLDYFAACLCVGVFVGAEEFGVAIEPEDQSVEIFRRELDCVMLPVHIRQEW